MTQSMGVSLCDIVRNVIKQANDEEADEPLASVLKWLDGDDGPAAWIGTHVVDTAAFRTALKTPDLGVDGLLEQCKTAAAAYVAASAAAVLHCSCLLYTSPSPRDATLSRMPSSA